MTSFMTRLTRLSVRTVVCRVLSILSLLCALAGFPQLQFVRSLQSGYTIFVGGYLVDGTGWVTVCRAGRRERRRHIVYQSLVRVGRPHRIQQYRTGQYYHYVRGGTNLEGGGEINERNEVSHPEVKRRPGVHELDVP